VLLSRKEEEEPQFFSTVRPEEIPEIPSNKFLFRGSPPKKVEADRFVSSGIFAICLIYNKFQPASCIRPINRYLSDTCLYF